MSVSPTRAIIAAIKRRGRVAAALPPAWRGDDEDVVFCRSHRQIHEIRWCDRVPIWIWIVAATDVVWIACEIVEVLTL